MKFDLKYCHVGKRKVTGNTVTYTDKMHLGAISCDINININSASQNEDGVEQYKIDRVIGGTLGYETGTFNDEQEVYLLGVTKEENGDVISKDLDIAPELGQGFMIGLVNKDGSHSWKAYFLNRVKYKKTSESVKTGGKEVNLESYKLEADWMIPEDGYYKRTHTFSGPTAEKDAMDWIDSKFDASAVEGGGA